MTKNGTRPGRIEDGLARDEIRAVGAFDRSSR